MQTAECRVAIEQLLAYLEDPNLHRADAGAAIDHIRECPHCEKRVGYLVRALTTHEEDRLTCQECQDLLPDYLQAEAAGRASQARWHPVALHLETCPHCSATYATLSDLIGLTFEERGEEPPDYPVPDLSFLRPEPAEIPWRLDELGRLIIEFSADLLRALQPPAYQPAYATFRLKSDQLRRTLCQLSLKEAVRDLEVSITAEEMRGDATQCTIVVEVNIPSRGGWPNLADTEVTVKRGELQLDTQLTDAFGKAVFEGMATDDLARLVFEIKPGERET
jgi:glutaredoxin